MNVRGTCKCGHDAKQHDGIDGRFASHTPCTGEVLAPSTGSGLIQRTMRCTCADYSPEVVPVPVPSLVPVKVTA